MLLWFLSRWPLWIILIFAVLLLLVLFSTINIDCYARSRKNDNYVSIRINGIYGLFKYTIKLPRLGQLNSMIFIHREKISENLKDEFDNASPKDWNADAAINIYKHWNDLLSLLLELKGWMREVLKKVELKEWKWYSYVGTGDAMTAAMTCGLLWSVKGMLFGTLSHLVKVKEKPVVKIEPIYQTAFFATEWSCVAKMKGWHAIVAGIYLAVRIASWKKKFNLKRNMTARTN